MGTKTKIQWADSTVNPTLGCDGCELWNPELGIRKCYAGALTARFGSSNPGLANDFNVAVFAPGRVLAAAQWPDLTGQPRPNKPWLDNFPRLIFVGDMADTLSSAISFEYLRDEVITPVESEAGRKHCFLWLTKRPQRMAEFSVWLKRQKIDWPTNLWAGTSVTTQMTTSRISSLLKVGSKETFRFVSVEPQWEDIDLRKWLPQLDWIIQGGHSGDGSHPFALEWADSLRKQCADHGVAYFLKQLGAIVTDEGTKLRGKPGQKGDWEHWPERLRVRQFPPLNRVCRKT